MHGRRSTRRLLAALAVVGLIGGCTGGGDDADGTAAEATDATPAPGDGSIVITDEPGADDFTDEGLVPETVEEVVLDDDVIIATPDGQRPTTTVEPPAGGEDVLRPPENEPVVTVTQPPLPPPAAIQQVASLSATHTDTIAALGLAGILVGVDPDSTIPAGANVVRDQLLADDLDPDDLRALGVDLVVIGDDPGDIAAQELAAAGIPYFLGARPATRPGVEQQILDLATALGRPETGVDLVATMRSEIDEIVRSVPPTDGLTYFHEIDPGLATYPAGSLVDALYGELGLAPIAPAAPGVIFLPESQVLAGDPDVIVLGDVDCCAATSDRVAARPGWSNLSAVRNGAVIEVPDDVANRWGTNIVELLRLVAGGVAAAAG